MPITQPVLIGFVFERTLSGVTPVAGVRVSVDFSGGFGGWEPSATTLTDAAGRYLLCGIANATRGLVGELIAGKVGYHGVIIPLSTPVTSHLDIELVPDRVPR
jgi:Na+/glutamate symporter